MQKDRAAIYGLLAGPQRRLEIAPMGRERSRRPTSFVGYPAVVVVAESELHHAELKLRFRVVRIERDGLMQIGQSLLGTIKPAQRVCSVGEKARATTFNPTHCVVTGDRFVRT